MRSGFEDARTLYRELLGAERRLALAFDQMQPDAEPPESFNQFHEYVNSVILLSPAEVATRAVAFNRAVAHRMRVSLHGAADPGGASATWCLKERRNLVDAMRRDVDADSAAIERWDRDDEENQLGPAE